MSTFHLYLSSIERESLGEASVDVDSTDFSDSEGGLRLIDAFASLDSTESLELEEEDTVSLNTTIPSANLLTHKSTK